MQLNLPKSELKISKSSTNILPNLEMSPNFVNISFKKSPTTSVVKPDQISD